MRNCVVCRNEYQESTDTQKYCDRICKRAAYLKTTREEYLDLRRKREKRFAEEVKRAGENGFGNCVIFRDDGGYNRQYLTADGAWTINRAKAARCLSSTEAEKLAERYGVVFFGSFPGRPTCCYLSFARPDKFDRWFGSSNTKVDAKDHHPTERFIQADLESAVPGLRARQILHAPIIEYVKGGPGGF